MKENEMRDLIEWALATAFKTITPWKLREDYRHGTEEGYVNGYNACIKEIKKNRERYLKNFNEKIAPRKEKN